MTDIASFVAKKRRKVVTETIIDKIDKLPWYLKPIEKESFISRKDKKGNFYICHKKWSEHIWIGPYADEKEVEKIIDSYVKREIKTNSIHSVWIDDTESFFS